MCVCVCVCEHAQQSIADLFEIHIVNKERLSGAYRLSAYYLSKISSELLVTLFIVVLMVGCFYFLAGFTVAAGAFFAFIGLVMLGCLAAMVRT